MDQRLDEFTPLLIMPFDGHAGFGLFLFPSAERPQVAQFPRQGFLRRPPETGGGWIECHWHLQSLESCPVDRGHRASLRPHGSDDRGFGKRT